MENSNCINRVGFITVRAGQKTVYVLQDEDTKPCYRITRMSWAPSWTLKGPSDQIRLEWYQWICLSKGRPKNWFLVWRFNFEFLKDVQSLKALTAKIYRITNALGGRQDKCSPNSNPNRRNVLISGVSPSELSRAGNKMLWQIFSLDSRTLKKISMCAPIPSGDH
jgi:hypothetical protein